MVFLTQFFPLLYFSLRSLIVCLCQTCSFQICRQASVVCVCFEIVYRNLDICSAEFLFVFRSSLPSYFYSLGTFFRHGM